MSEQSSQDSEGTNEHAQEFQDRREFLGSLGKWSSASVIAAVGSAAWLATSGDAQAGVWVNRRGGWLNGRGGWVNRIGGGGGGWINGRGGGGAGWVNRRGGGGWINRR